MFEFPPLLYGNDVAVRVTFVTSWMIGLDDEESLVAIGLTVLRVIDDAFAGFDFGVAFLGLAFFGAAFFGVDFFGAAFFLAGAFVAFFGAAFLAGAFLAGALVVFFTAFFGVAFLTGLDGLAVFFFGAAFFGAGAFFAGFFAAILSPYRSPKRALGRGTILVL
ncbi:MAG: hypothetical protein EBU84_01760 [Actinobacteria bacterium]|nr:hypothetical protein [Actinomycetota bacterium]